MKGKKIFTSPLFFSKFTTRRHHLDHVICIHTHFQPRDADLQVNHNPFVETALCYALSYVTTVSGNPIIAPAAITILADNDYYSTPSDLSPDPNNRFHNFGVPLSKAHKTGL